jgi:hypothetical protein
MILNAKLDGCAWDRGSDLEQGLPQLRREILLRQEISDPNK